MHVLHYIPERRGQAFDVIEDVSPSDAFVFPFERRSVSEPWPRLLTAQR